MEGYPSLVKGTVLKTVRSPCGAWVRTPHLPFNLNKGAIMSNVYKEWVNEQRDKAKQLKTSAPNKALIGKWTKEQRENAEQLLKSWLQTRQKGNSQ